MIDWSEKIFIQGKSSWLQLGHYKGYNFVKEKKKAPTLNRPNEYRVFYSILHKKECIHRDISHNEFREFVAWLKLLN